MAPNDSLGPLKINDDPEAIFQEGWLLCDVGEYDRGLELLRRAVEKGYFVAPTLSGRPQFDALRERPASRALVAEAEDGDTALEMLKTDISVDLLFTDMVMPGALNGHDLALAAQKLRPGLKVLLTSGFAKAAIETGIPATSFEHFLSKPYRKADLAAKLRDILHAPSP